jgi:hypothetical protein
LEISKITCLWRIIRRWIIPKTDFSGAGDFASIASYHGASSSDRDPGSIIYE